MTIGNSVTSIGNDAFYGTGLTSVTIPNSVTSIGAGAFAACASLTSIVVASGNTKYDSRDNCNAIIEKSTNTLIAGCQNTIIPNSVTSIGQSAFESCDGLTSVTIPNSVTSIGNKAFEECSGLTSVTIGNSVTSIGDYAFMYCDGLTSVTIPNSVISIGESAFDTCSGLTSVTIPNSVTSIGDYAFGLVPNIVYSGSATGSPWGARSVNGYVDGFLVYSDNTKTNLLACSSQATGTIEIPNSVTSIGESAFDHCTGLTSITIPNSVISIGESAFDNCSGLTSVTIPNSVTSIGDYAFVECSNLETVTINAESLESYGSDAFEGTAEGLKIYVPAGSVDTYKAAWADYEYKIVAITAPAAYDVTANLANGAYWATFYSNAGNYQAPVGTQVFAVTLNTTTAEITMTEIEDRIVKSGKGVVLKQTTGSSDSSTTITMTLYTETAPAGDFSGSSLMGTMTSITNPSYGNIYVLNNGTYGVGFYKLKSGKTIDANKAYLTTAAGAREFFLFDEATGIESIDHSPLTIDHSVYDLQGRRVAQPTKGLYIVNGKKVIK